MEKSFRVHATINEDTLLNVNMKQDFDFLEILSLTLSQKDAYRLHSSNYGVVVGRVLANDAFGIPNAKVSIFIERDISDSNALKNIYPYSNTMSRDRNSIRYNLLPDYSDDTCYKVVGTFPRKRYLLDDTMQLEVYDKYWKYTTVTNNSGDYMIFGVPSGSHQIHVDIDLSDIGVLSQRPRDFIYKGHNVNEFDNPSQFKDSTNLDSLQQIITQNKSTTIYPFWGDMGDTRDSGNNIIGITRCDLQINYKFEPTCVFMGSIVSDNEGNSIGHKCAPSEDSGVNSQLVAGEGTIEMIRKTPDGLIEEFPIKGNLLIDSDGVWCYQIPMNLDYIGTDEYGNIVPTDDPSKGIPTRAQVRFRISKRETGEEGFSTHTAKYLVPMNPIMSEDRVEPTTQEQTGLGIEKMYNFGSNTPQSCFRDLYWNNVYSVKNFIPKVQVAHRAYALQYGALKGSNLVDNQNPVPFNKLNIYLPFSYMLICIIFQIIMLIISLINKVVYALMELKTTCLDLGWFGDICPFGFIPEMHCIPLNAGLGDGGNIAYYPGCECEDNSAACEMSSCPDGMDDGCVKRSDEDELEDKIQQALALDYKIVKLDFYQDWLNGCLYMPLWFWRKRKKRTYLFGLIKRNAKNEFCNCDGEYDRLKTYVTCDIIYEDTSMTTNDLNTDENENRWHKRRREWVRYRHGLIKGVENKDGLTAYYYVAYQPTTEDPIDVGIDKRTKPFLFARLYATDIILLGNLNEDNIYGIPQTFKTLPSTTANIPPIATVEEVLSEQETSKDADIIEVVDDSGTTITTGMDWGHNGGDQTPKYKNGLFIDLACTYAGTKAKSCINVERLSELGVNLDSTYEMSYAHQSSDIKKGIMDSDGFINKLELDDLDNRAAFATLNHIGFIPQDYQESIGSYTTQMNDERTGYLIPKFKYIYPVDFDGRLQPIMARYADGFEQALYDEKDQSYLTFRLGAEKNDNASDNLEGRIRHFYYVEEDDEGMYNMPLYNNSFYFYFGINKGNTAIDKFNEMFYAPCSKKDKKPFSYDLTYMGRSYCPETYEYDGNKAYNGYAYIRFTSDDIVSPFTYRLYEASSRNLVIEEIGMTETDFVIGGIIAEDGSITMNDKGAVKYQMHEEGEDPQPVDSDYGVNGLTNRVYTLEIIDFNGRKIKERIELKTQKITLDFDTEPLKTKFYSTASTRMDYICNDYYSFYGLIRIKGFTVDGIMYYVTGATVMAYDSENDAYKIALVGVSTDVNENNEKISAHTAHALVRVAALDSPNVGWVRDCMCDTGNTVYSVNGQLSNIADATYQYWFGLRDPSEDNKINIKVEGQTDLVTLNKIATLFVYQPNRFTLTVSQLCPIDNGQIRVLTEVVDNTTSDIAAVTNGISFNTFLNDMPVKFMIGTTTDSLDGRVADDSNFYYVNGVYDLVEDGHLNTHISGWFGLHQESSYQWNTSQNQVLKRNEDMWGDFVNFNNDITNHSAKARILQFKFNSMFSLSSVGYVVDKDTKFQYKAVGGIKPTLYRTVAPKYSDVEEMNMTYRLTDGNSAAGLAEYPNIVGDNYSPTMNGHIISHDKGVNYNKYYGSMNYYMVLPDNKKLGNYFAAFSNNGGYISRSERDTSIHFSSIPNMAKVTPMPGNTEKKLGVNEEGRIENVFWPAFHKPEAGGSLPYLRALFVDRRLDYEFVIAAPCMAKSTFNLYPVTYNMETQKSTPDPRENIWKSARISGFTYNGVEMSYDKDYNIISATTNEDGTSASPNIRLEYSYNLSDGDFDAKTYHNSQDYMIWEEDTYDREIVNPQGETVHIEGDKTNQIMKRFYEATFVGRDIRNYFWSLFNGSRLNLYATNSVYNHIDKEFYVFKYPITNEGWLYNGDFTRERIIADPVHNYPTKRFIDVCNIMPDSDYDLNIHSCSYSIHANYNEDGTISAVARDGGGISLRTTFENPVLFTQPNDVNDDFANAIYRRDGSSGGYAVFKTQKVSVMFVINTVTNDNFRVYTAYPKMIRVMPYIQGTDGRMYDGISYIKTATPNSEIAAAGSILDAVNELILYKFNEIEYELHGLFGPRIPGDILAPAGVDLERLDLSDGGLTETEYFYKEGKPLPSDSADFQSISFYKYDYDVSGDDVRMFAICVERMYVGNANANLKRRVNTFEFSEIIDTRPMNIKVLDKFDDGTPATYLEKKASTTSNVDIDIHSGGDTNNDNNDDGENDEEITATGSVNLENHIQVMTIDMLLPLVADPTNGCCKAIADNETNAYLLYLENGSETFILSSTKTDKTSDMSGTHIKITFQWKEEMGVMADTQWGNNTNMAFVVKTSSGFTYRTAWSKLTWGGASSQPSYNNGSKKSTLPVGGKEVTVTQLENL